MRKPGPSSNERMTKWLWRGIKVGAAVELALFGAAYYFYRQLNRDQEFRYSCYKNCPYILNGYYLIGETIGKLKTREEDLKAWRAQNKDIKDW